MSTELPSDKELIKEFVNSQFGLSNMKSVAEFMVTKFLEFKEEKSKEASVSKDYEILSSIMPDDSIDHWEQDIVHFGISQSLKSKYPIFSVKRISDGVVFKVGDNTSNGKITSFTPVYNRIHVNFENGLGYCLLSELSHSKVPLFQSADGCMVFQGDKIWWIDNEFCIRECIVDYAPPDDFSYKQFSTEQAAKEYINLHKPMFSLKDIQDCYSTKSYATFEWFIASLKELKRDK